MTDKDLEEIDLEGTNLDDVSLEELDMPDLDGPAFEDEIEQVPLPKKDRNPKKDSRKQKKDVTRSSIWNAMLKTIFWFFLSMIMFGLAVIFVCYAYFSQDLPSVQGLNSYHPKTVTYFYSDDGHIIGEYSHERRIVRPLSEIPLLVRQAFIAVEDANFYHHGGVNFLAIARATYRNLTGSQLQGASTITQQVVRSFLLTNERRLPRKIREIILAFRLEGALSKDEILYLYLNQIYLGQGAYGVEAAAQTYFDKHVEQLTIAEVAMLAGITHSPEGKNPIRNPDEARARQLYGISRLVLVGFITPEQAEEARNEVLNIIGERPNPNTTVAPYFTEHVRRLLVERLGEESLYNDGWRIYTTVNIEAQKAAEVAVSRGLWEYSRRRGFKGPEERLATEEEIAKRLIAQEKIISENGLIPSRLYQAVIMEVKSSEKSLKVNIGSINGHIEKKNLDWVLGKGALDKQFARGDVIWVRLDEQSLAFDAKDRTEALARIGSDQAETSRSLILEQRTDLQSALLSMDLADGSIKAMIGGRDFNESQFNRSTQSQRQPGSSFKPIVYTAAMDNGFTPGSVMIDGPVVIDDLGSRQRWKPLNSDHKFLGPMTLYNALVASRNLISIKILERIGFEALDRTAQALGITTILPHSHTVALGSYGVTMPELLTAYSAFPNQGRRVELRYITRIEDRYGRTISFEPVFHQAISSGTACVLTWMLRGVVAQGTGTSVKPLGRPVGGKTGTTNDASDAWFVGFTPENVTAVWLGTDTPRPRAVVEVGGRAAGPIFLYYMQEFLKDVPIIEFTVPDDAQIEPGGAFGICYKAGTVGTGLSETQTAPLPEESFLRDDLNSELIMEDTDPN